MILDTNLQLCSQASVAVAAGTSLIGSQIDAAIAGELDSSALAFTIVVRTAIITGGSAGTIAFQLASDTTAAVSTTAAQPVVVTETFVTGATPIPVGTVLHQGILPRDIGTYTPSRRFLGVLLIVGTTTITAGAVDVFLEIDPGRWAALPVAVN